MHLLVVISDLYEGASDGSSGKPCPANGEILKPVSSMKRFTNKQAGFNILRRSCHDLIIRNKEGYLHI